MTALVEKAVRLPGFANHCLSDTDVYFNPGMLLLDEMLMSPVWIGILLACFGPAFVLRMITAWRPILIRQFTPGQQSILILPEAV